MKRRLVMVVLPVLVLLLFIGQNHYREVISGFRRSDFEVTLQSEVVQGRVVDFDFVQSYVVVRTETGAKILVRISEVPGVETDLQSGRRFFSFSISPSEMPFKSPKNFGGFDYDCYLWSEGISGRYTATDYRSEAGTSVWDLPLAGKLALMNRIDTYFSEPSAAFIKAILLGDHSGFEAYDRYREVGLAHLFAVSGLHFSMLYLIMRRLLVFQNRVIKSGMIVITLFSFLMVIGAPYSAQRAFFLAFYLEAAFLMNRKADVMTGCFFSSAAILFFNPQAILSTAFQLSFYAYFSVAVILRPISAKDWKGKLIFAGTLHLLLFPATLYYFGSGNSWSFLINMAAIPLISVLFPIIGLSVGIPILARPAEWLIGGFDFLSAYLPTQLSSGVFLKAGDYRLLLLTMAFFSVMSVFYKTSVKRYIFSGLFLTGILLSSVLSQTVFVNENAFSIHFVDVGHGDMSLIRAGSHAILIDTGDLYFDSVGYLRAQGIEYLDAVILSHAHGDHTGGIASILETYEVGALYLNEETRAALAPSLKGYTGRIVQVTEPMGLEYGKSHIEIWPLFSEESNDNALIVGLERENLRGYFLGDVSADILDDLHLSGDIHFIKVPHHGSKNSDSADFYETYSIDFGVISCSTRYGFPSAEILDRLDLTNTIPFVTWRSGEIVMTEDGQVTTYLGGGF
jgi:competence protein ComEC